MLDLVVMLCVQAEIMQLSSQHWPTREAATQRLEVWGPLAWKQLAQARAQSSDAEVRNRCRRLLDQADDVAELQAVEAILAWRIGGHPLPWVDCWGFDSAAMNHWLGLANNHPLRHHLPARRYEEYRLATALWVREGQQAGDPFVYRGHDPKRALAKERAWIRSSFMGNPQLAALMR